MEVLEVNTFVSEATYVLTRCVLDGW